MKVKGKVTRVIDGDTVKVEISVRLNKIDSPEMSGIERELGLITKEYLEKKLTGKYITLEGKANDRYYRFLADIFLGSESITEDLLEKKLVEVYTPANHNNGKLDI
jgi:endonuclease YncB( thermonuclease family)